MTQGAPVAIVGGGIAGLTAALSLARKGIATDIFERTAALSEVGAGLQLSPNATRILFTLGLEQVLAKVWSEPSSICLIEGSSFRTIASVPAGDFARDRWGFPYGVLHRADLQRALLGAVLQEPLCRLYLDAPVDDASPDTLCRISGRSPLFVVGADGVWSNIRNSVKASGKETYSGYVAWRFTLDEDHGAGLFDASKVTAFLGPGAHLVAYPLPQRRFNIVAITRASASLEKNPGDGTATLARQRMLADFSGWHGTITGMLKQAPIPTAWPLHQMAPGAWHQGGEIVLIGDAAHAMLPFAAQGAAMAIEDAFELADFTARGETLSAFAQHRMQRVARVRSRGEFNRLAYHARGPVRIGRNLFLSMRSSEKLAADLDWLYGYVPRD